MTLIAATTDWDLWLASGGLAGEDSDTTHALVAAAFDAIFSTWGSLGLERGEVAKWLVAFAAEHGIAALSADAACEVAFARSYSSANPVASAVFEQRFVPAIRGKLAPMGLNGATVDDVIQQTRVRLLAPSAEGEIRLVRYAGFGKLLGLAVVTAQRIAIDFVRKERPQAELGEQLMDTSPDPELRFLQQTYREAFAQACKQAIADLTPQQRTLLRFHHIDRVSLEKLATMQQVHRATIVRRLADIRAEILQGTKKRLAVALGGASASEIESVIALVGSQFGVSIARLLATGAQ